MKGKWGFTALKLSSVLCGANLEVMDVYTWYISYSSCRKLKSFYNQSSDNNFDSLWVQN